MARTAETEPVNSASTRELPDGLPAAPTPTRAELRDFTATRHMLFIAALAMGIGALCAGIAIVLMMMIGLITNLLYYHRVSTTLVSPDANTLGWWAVPIPIIGGLIIGFMARYGSERIRGHGIPEAMETILVGGSKAEPKLAILKPISSAISIGTGGPFGAEGPIILTGGAVGSLVGQFFHLTAAERKTLLVAGAAAGMAATFNAPIASVLLAVELLLFEWKPRSLVPVALASVVATVIRRQLLGGGPIMLIPSSPSLGVTGLVAAAAAGILAGVLAWLLTLGVYGAEDAFRLLPIHWMWWPALGGIVVGVGGMFFPRALGVGYDTIAAELHGDLPFAILIGVILSKGIIWCIALGSGTSGGILAPLLLIGGALGGIEGAFFPGHAPGIWALIGMAAALSGVMRSPLTAILFAFELTGAANQLLPLMVACVLAHGVSVLVLKRSILTEKIARRGLHVSREYAVDPLEVLLVGEMAQANVASIAAEVSISAVRQQLTASHEFAAQRLYPVLGPNALLLGVVSRTDVLAQPSTDVRAISEIMRPSMVVAYPDETLRMVAVRMISTSTWRLPVVARDNPQHLEGLITQRDLLRARERLLTEERHRERVLHLRLLAPTLQRP